MSTRQGSIATGIILIIVGVILLLINLNLFRPEFFIVAIGASFLVAYVFWRRIGFLIPGMILTWLGVAIVLLGEGLIPDRDSGAVILLSLGLAFVSVYAFMGTRRHWWPLIPGGILLPLGILLLATEEFIALTIQQIFNIIIPVAVIALGIWLIVRQFLRRS